MRRYYRRHFALPALFPGAVEVAPRRFRVRCPVHQDEHPSAIVDWRDDRGWAWHCFACGEFGDALDVVTKRDGLAGRAAFDAVGQGQGQVGLSERWRTAQDASAREPKVGHVIICDACGFETVDFSPRTYRTTGKASYDYSVSAELEALCRGWELAAGVNACVGPRCLERAA